MSAGGRIAIAGSIAQKPGQAGHTWQFLQYLLGFKRLGWEVLFLDRVGDASAGGGARYLKEVMRAFGLEGSYSLALDDGRHLGVDRAGVLRFLREAELLINVMGFLRDDAVMDAARLRVSAPQPLEWDPRLFGIPAPGGPERGVR